MGRVKVSLFHSFPFIALLTFAYFSTKHQCKKELGKKLKANFSQSSENVNFMQ